MAWSCGIYVYKACFIRNWTFPCIIGYKISKIVYSVIISSCTIHSMNGINFKYIHSILEDKALYEKKGKKKRV